MKYPVSVEPEVAVETEQWQAFVLDRTDDAVLMDPASLPLSEWIAGLINGAVRPELPGTESCGSAVDTGQDDLTRRAADEGLILDRERFGPDLPTPHPRQDD